MRRIILSFFVLMAGGMLPLVAQTCPSLQEGAFSVLAEACGELQSGEICYGTPALFARAADADFDEAGDTVAAARVDFLSATTEDNTWGSAQLELSGYGPDTWSPAPFRLLVFGNALVQNLGQEGATVQTATVVIQAAEGANVRSGPATDFRVIQPLPDGAIVKATGQTADGAWLRVQTRDGQNGWLIAGAVVGDSADLPIVTPDSEPPSPLYAPFQAIQLESGVGDAPCDGAPQSGLLLQVADASQQLALALNGVAIESNGTLFLQAQSGFGVVINVVEGAAFVTVGDTRRYVAAGSRVVIPLGDDGQVGAPPAPEPYDYAAMLALPMRLLPRAVAVGLDIRTILTPAPTNGNSPLEGMLVNDKCRITTGPGGANLRSGPGTIYPIVGAMGFRESAEPDGRAIGADGAPWWRLTVGVWVRQDTTVFGGDCVSVPTAPAPPLPTGG